MEPFYLCNSELFGLSNSTAVVYNFLCKVNNVSTGKSYYKRANIATACHISESTVIRALRTLCAKGLLEIKRRFDAHGRQTSNDYILIDNPQLKMESDQPSEKKSENEANAIKPLDKNTLCYPRLFKCGLNAFQHPLTPNEIKVYSYLSFRAGKDGACMPSKKDIAGDCSISVSTVWRAILRLYKAGLIEIRRQTRAEAFGNNGTSVNLYMLKSAHTAPQEPYSPFAHQGSDVAVTQPEISDIHGKVLVQYDQLRTSSADLFYTKQTTAGIPSSAENQSIGQPFLSLCRRISFLSTNDTLPYFTGDIPKTMPRKKATDNSRKRRLFSRLAEWYNRVELKFAGFNFLSAKLE